MRRTRLLGPAGPIGLIRLMARTVASPLQRIGMLAVGAMGASVLAAAGETPPPPLDPPSRDAGGGLLLLDAGDESLADAHAPRAVFKDCEACPEMVVLPDGTAMGRTGITRAQFAAFAAATGFDDKGCYGHTKGTDWHFRVEADWRAPGFEQTDAHPVTCVSWMDATAYADWLSKETGRPYRLPTFEESVAAALGDAMAAEGDAQIQGERPEPRWWWGDDESAACGFANLADAAYAEATPGDERSIATCRDAYPNTAPAGSFAPNGNGLYDMAGNLWEWTNSCEKGDCGKAVFRGGSWDTPAGDLAARHKWADRIIVRSFGLGFRMFTTDVRVR